MYKLSGEKGSPGCLSPNGGYLLISTNTPRLMYKL